MSVLVHGPMGCGKTRNSEALRRHFGMRHILDGWTPGDPVPPHTLILTYHEPQWSSSSRVRIVSFSAAMQAIAGAS